MQRGRGGRDPFFDFGNPFAGFGNFGGFGGQRSLISSFFGGRDPFDDPFFTHPFGGGFESSFFGNGASPFPDMHPPTYIENQAAEPNRSRGLIIRELNSDDEKEEGHTDHNKSKGPIIQELDSDDEKEVADKAKNGNSRKHSRSGKEPYAEDGDDEFEERKSKHLQHRNDHNRFYSMQQQQQQQQPRTQSFTFQSSSVSYGGANGAYYTSSKTRRTGSDGVTIEERREADSSTREATHGLSRGLYNKGHTMTRKLNSDGRVDTMQTLHNLNEDELPGFEDAWKGNVRQHLPGWTGSLDNIGAGGSGQNQQANQGGWALPSTEGRQHSQRMFPDARERAAGSSHLQNTRGPKGSSEVKDKSNYNRWRRE